MSRTEFDDLADPEAAQGNGPPPEEERLVVPLPPGADFDAACAALDRALEGDALLLPWIVLRPAVGAEVVTSRRFLRANFSMGQPLTGGAVGGTGTPGGDTPPAEVPIRTYVCGVCGELRLVVDGGAPVCPVAGHGVMGQA